MAKLWRGTFILCVLGIVLMKPSPIIMLGKERCSLLPTLGWSESHVVCCLFDWRPSPDNGEMAMCRCYAVTLWYHHLTKSSSTTSSATSSALQSQGDPSLDSRDDTTSRHDGLMGRVYLLTPPTRLKLRPALRWNIYGTTGLKMKTVNVHTWLLHLWRFVNPDELD